MDKKNATRAFMEVAIYKRGLRNEVKHAWPEWMTFTYVNEEEDNK